MLVYVGDFGGGREGMGKEYEFADFTSGAMGSVRRLLEDCVDD